MNIEVENENTLPLSPEDRLESDKHIEDEYKSACDLLHGERYKEALKKFKFVFASRKGAQWYLDRSRMIKLTKNYAPSLIVAKRWRNDKEQLILAGKTDLSLIQQWDALNFCLGEKTRTLDTFMRLKAAGADDGVLNSILGHVWRTLVVRRKYEVLRPYLRHLGFHLLLNATEHDCYSLFPGSFPQVPTEKGLELERFVSYARGDGILAYQVALGLNETVIASEFAKKLLSIEFSDYIFAGLIKGAIRARAYPEAMALFEEAKQHFSKRQLALSSKAIKTLPAKATLPKVKKKAN